MMVRVVMAMFEEVLVVPVPAVMVLFLLLLLVNGHDGAGRDGAGRDGAGCDGACYGSDFYNPNQAKITINAPINLTAPGS